MDKTTCQPASGTPAPKTLDFSLQMQVAVQSVLQFNDKNPCAPSTPPAAAPMAAARKSAPAPPAYQDAPRIERGGTASN